MPLLIDMLTLAPEKHTDTPKSKAHQCAGNLNHPRFEGAIDRFSSTFIVQVRSTLYSKDEDAPHTYTILIHHIGKKMYALRYL